MQHLRIGSTVTLFYVDYNTSGGSTGAYAPGTVSNITDSYIELDSSGVGTVFPWSNVKRISVTTD